MKESYREGLANHSGPEPCECSCKVALEALDRGICRQGIELRNLCFGTPMGSETQKAIQLRTLAPARSGPAESKTPGMQRNSERENREAPSLPARQYGGPEGERDER
jgi:hypothetical protein